MDEAHGPIPVRPRSVCHFTLPWVISFSLDHAARAVT